MTTTFDFGQLAKGNEGAWAANTGLGAAGGSFDDVTDFWTVGGIGVKATGANSKGTNVSKAYLDDFSNGEPGGLGVCSNVVNNACSPASDDNIGIGDEKNGAFESVTLEFTKSVKIGSLELRGDNHFLLSDGFIGINGSNVDIAGLATFLNTLASNSTFTFSRLNQAELGDGKFAKNFYVTSLTAVPLPAALPLAMAAFGGLALLGRRRKAVA